MSEPLKVTLTQGNGTVRVTSTLTVTYSEARCPNCNGLTMTVPEARFLDIRAHATSTMALGRVPVTRCRKCGAYVEVIAHR